MNGSIMPVSHDSTSQQPGVTPSTGSLLTRCQQFSRPDEHYDHGFAEVIAVTHARAVVSEFATDPPTPLSGQALGVLEFLRAWACGPTRMSTVWHPAFGALEWHLETGEPDWLPAAAQLCLQLSSTGHPGAWSLRLPEPVRWRWKGDALPAGQGISVSSDGRHVRLRIDGEGAERTAVLDLDADGRWPVTEVIPRITVPGTDDLVLVPSDTVESQLAIEDEFHSIVDFPAPSAALAEQYARGLEVLARYAPQYHEWVVRILRGVVPCHCGGSRTRSSSWREAPGTVLVSTAPSPILIAEMLVHEACHQYFYLARRLGPMTEPGHDRTYYSPAVDRRRPLDKILMAFHAFANVLAFYRSAAVNGLVDDVRARTEERLRDDVASMQADLVGNSGLSSWGAALVEPLAENHAL